MRILTSHTQTIQFIALTRRPNPAKFLATLFIPILLSACGGGGGSSTAAPATPIAATPAPTPVAPATDPLDDQLLPLVEAEGLIGDAAFNRTLPTINDAEAQLGKLLFFSKSLGGDFDVACVTCHHPMLGGGDALSLPVGVGAEQPNLLGPGRIPDPTTSTDGLPNVPRNSPTVFNIGLWDSGLFHDSRVESFGKEEFANGAGSDIRTPDTAFGIADVNAGANLVAAQARFPVTSQEEMRGETFEAGNSNDAVRRHLAARVGNYAEGLGELLTNTWLTEFQTAFNSTADAETLITFDNITPCHCHLRAFHGVHKQCICAIHRRRFNCVNGPTKTRRHSILYIRRRRWRALLYLPFRRSLHRRRTPYRSLSPIWSWQR